MRIFLYIRSMRKSFILLIITLVSCTGAQQSVNNDVADNPLGPYTYADNNPLLRKTDGLVTGTARVAIPPVITY